MFEVDFHILNQKATPAIYADTLANRPAASFAGRLFVDTASPYGIYRDTGSSWVQIASNGGGGSSTGVNGLNGTTNIGLGGTLANNTTIAAAQNSFLINNASAIQFSTLSGNLINSIYAAPNYVYLEAQNNSLAIFNQFVVSSNKTQTFFTNAGYGLILDDTTGKFALGDYNNDRKYNSIVVNDNTDRFYFTTSYNQANTDQDLFFVSNNAGANERFVRLGDFNSYTNSTVFVLDDKNNSIDTFGVNGQAGISLNFLSEFFTFGSNSAEIQCDNANQLIRFTTNNILLNGSLIDTASHIPTFTYLTVTINGNIYQIPLYT
jgi:hypothetical protein